MKIKYVAVIILMFYCFFKYQLNLVIFTVPFEPQIFRCLYLRGGFYKPENVSRYVRRFPHREREIRAFLQFYITL